MYLESKLEENMDLFFNPLSLKFDQEKYDNDDTGFKMFFESFVKFKDKIKEKDKFNYMIVIVIAIKYVLIS